MAADSKRVKIPVLMYHDVASAPPASSGSFNIKAPYGIDTAAFKEQMKVLSEKGYKSILFEELASVGPAVKPVIITFDDGLAGNFAEALPVLKKYGYRAVFFVISSLVGTPGYMTWDELEILTECGMSVSSHTVNHESLETLSMDKVVYELVESKRVLEERLGVEVKSISFPHGSYTKKVLQAAVDAGYEYICTSEMVANYASSSRPVVLGRIAVKRNLNIEKFERLVGFDAREFLRQKAVKGSKNLVKSILGKNNYGRLWNLFYKAKG